LFGSGQGQPFSRIWEELGITPEQQFVHHDELMQISDPSGKLLIVYSDPDRLKQHLIAISPANARLIQSFCAGIRTLTHFDLSLLQQKPKQLMTVGDWGQLGWKMFPFVCPMARWGNLSAQEFAN
jgi:phytoene dehydrogenase-like protein